MTTHANALLRPIHDRMPVMYRRDMGRQWLEESISDDLELSLVTKPVLSEELKAYQVSSLVNSPDNDSPECVRRVSAANRVKSQLSLLTVEVFPPGDSLGAIAWRITDRCT